MAQQQKKRNGLGIALVVLDVAAWGVFGYFLFKTIVAGTSITSCTSADCAGQGAEQAANYVPWVIGSAFAASILLTAAILVFRLRTGAGGPTSWDQVAQMSGGMTGQSWPSTPPTVSNFQLPTAGPTWGPPQPGSAQASVVAARTLASTPTGMQMEVDLDVTVPGQAPRRVTKQLTVPPGGLARLYPGAVVAVSVNPANPADVTINLG
jgi:hypothetical protein